MEDFYILIILIISNVIAIGIPLIKYLQENHNDKGRKEIFVRKKKINWAVLLLLLFGISGSVTGIITGIIQYNKQKRTQSITIELQKKNEKNDSTIRALSLANLDSVQKVLGNEVAVLKTTNQIMNFQAISLAQITGGDNKPAILWTIGGKSGQKFDRQKMEYVGEMEEINSLNLFAANLGRTNIKSLSVTVEDKYSYARRFIQKDSSMTFIPRDEYYNFGNDPLDVNSSLFKQHTFEVNNLSEGKQKNIYNIPIPVGNKKYDYKIDVEWSNGSYSEILSLVEGKSGLHVKKLTILERGHEIIDQHKFFGRKRPIEYHTEFVEGKPIKFKGESYHVFWYKKGKNVCVSQNPMSILTYETYGNVIIDSPKNMEKAALKMLEDEFGM